jgi:hypothetical protein
LEHNVAAMGTEDNVETYNSGLTTMNSFHIIATIILDDTTVVVLLLQSKD